MAIWQEDNPLRRRLEAKVREGNWWIRRGVRADIPVEISDEDESGTYEMYIRSELGNMVYDFHHYHCIDPIFTEAPHRGTCLSCGERIKSGDEIEIWTPLEGYQVWEHNECSESRGNDAYDRAEAEGEMARMDAEYNAGKRDAETYRDNKELFGSDYAEAEQIKLERSGVYDY